MSRKYNLKLDRLPEEQLIYKSLKPVASLPKKVDLRPQMPVIQDQGDLGSCTANALCALFDYNEKKTFIPSRLFVYYNERKIENTILEDSGAYISDGIKSLKTYGVCSEITWPYNISQFTIEPPKLCYTEALSHKALDCKNIRNTLTDMKTCLASGFPFAVGIAVYESFESATVEKTGKVPMPNKRREQFLGGHAIACVGYDDTTNYWIMRNSWGPNWGDKGYFYLPYNYLLDNSLTSELWNITRITTIPNVPIKPNPRQNPYVKKNVSVHSVRS